MRQKAEDCEPSSVHDRNIGSEPNVQEDGESHGAMRLVGCDRFGVLDRVAVHEAQGGSGGVRPKETVLMERKTLKAKGGGLPDGGRGLTARARKKKGALMKRASVCLTLMVVCLGVCLAVGSATGSEPPASPGWLLAMEQASPSSRGGHVMAFDSARQRAVLFGGIATSDSGSG